MDKIYKMFGMKIKVHYNDSTVSKILYSELSIYPEIKNDCDTVVDKDIFVIEDNSFFKQYKFSRNPKIQFYNNEIVGYSLGIATIYWNIKNNKDIYFLMHSGSHGLAGLIRKIRDIQFCSVEEWSGQAFHESLLVNSLAFEKDMFVLHGSSMATEDGRVVLIGGTGGCGKTSTVLSLGKRHDMYFVSDDICPISVEGRVYPNYAYPKIYAYNTIGNDMLEKKVLEGESILSILQWKLRRRVNPSSVRRRKAPSELFNVLSENGLDKLRIDSYYMLNRSECVSEFSIRRIDLKTAVDASMLIIHNELFLFLNQVSYSKVNALYSGEDFQYDVDSIISNWAFNMRSAFVDVPIYQVNVPFNYDNELLKEQMTNIILKNLGNESAE